jgi:hypothetical protein
MVPTINRRRVGTHNFLSNITIALKKKKKNYSRKMGGGGYPNKLPKNSHQCKKLKL